MNYGVPYMGSSPNTPCRRTGSSPYGRNGRDAR